MSAKEPSGTRRYHETNMPRRDPISQGILNRIHGKAVDDKFASKLSDMNPETAKHFAKTAESNKQLMDEVIPKLVNRLSELEKNQQTADQRALAREKEIDNKFDQLLAAISNMGSPKPGKKRNKPADMPADAPAEDFQSEADDDLPPAEQ